MNIEYPYWYFDSAISSEKCNEIISLAKTKNKSSGSLISNKKKESISNNVIRNSTVAWIDDKWIFELIHPYIHAANKQAGWNWKFDCIEPIQFTKYALDQFYDWHPDGGSDFLSVYSNQSDSTKNGKIRKISVTINLVDGNDYEGGSLEFDLGINTLSFLKIAPILISSGKFEFFNSLFINSDVSMISASITSYSPFKIV